MDPSRENVHGETRKRSYNEMSLDDAWYKERMDEMNSKRRRLANGGEEQMNDESTLNNIDSIMANMKSQNTQFQIIGIKALRGLIEDQNPLDIEMLRIYNIVPTFIELLQKSDDTMLRYESILALSNIAGSSLRGATFLMYQHALPYIINLFHAPEVLVAEQAVWALINIANHGTESRDMILQYDVVENLIPLLNPDTHLSLLRSIVWLVLSIVRIKNLKFYNIKPLLPSLANILCSCDMLVKEDLCWAFVHLTEGDDVNNQAVIESGAVKYFKELLDSELCIIPALRCLGNIARGTDAQIEVVVNSGCLSKLVELLQHAVYSIKKEAAWTVSNIASGNQKHIQAILDSGIFPQIKNIFENGDLESQREAVRVVTNITVYGAPEQIFGMIAKQNIMRSFSELVRSNDSMVVEVVQTGLMKIFSLVNRSGSTNDFFIMIQQLGGMDHLLALQQHGNSGLNWLVAQLTELYASKQNQESQNAQNTN